MIIQGDSICKYNCRKINASVKKNSRAKIGMCGKSGINEKNIKEDRQRFLDKYGHDNHNTNESQNSQSDDEANFDETKYLNIG